MKNSMKVWLFCLSSVLFIGCDQVTKHLAKQHLMFREPITYLHKTIILEYVENTGAALSLGDNLSKPVSFWLLSIGPLICLAALFIYVMRKIQEFNRLKLFSFSLILAGGLGNIIDRLAHDRHVTDFMNVGINNFRTGIFNVADMCVTAGVIGLLIATYTDKPKPVQAADQPAVAE